MTTKATKATIKLGEIELDVFQLPNGEYRIGKAQILEVVEIANNRYTQIVQSKAGQSLALSSLEERPIVFENGKALTIELAKAPLVWQACTMLNRGNVTTAFSLMYAATVEALERRADAAFNVIRSEEERNNWFKLRMEDSKVFRRSLTDAMQMREELTGEKAPYGYATLRIYRRCGLYDKYQKYKKQGHKDFRSALTLGELEDLRACEEMIAQFMKKKNLDVMAAIDLYKSLFE
jgi:hypothetical protein